MTIELFLILGCIICVLFIAIIVVKINSKSIERKEMDKYYKNAGLKYMDSIQKESDCNKRKPN